MKNLIVYVFLGALLASCAKKNEPVPAVPNYCILTKVSVLEPYARDSTFMKICRNNNYFEQIDSIIKYDKNGIKQGNFLIRQFQDNKLVKEVYENSYSRIYTYNEDGSRNHIENGKIILKSIYDFNHKISDVIVFSDTSDNDTIKVYYGYNGRPSKITRDGGKLRYYRYYDQNNNFNRETYAVYNSQNSSDSTEKEILVFNKTFNFDSKLDPVVYKYFYSSFGLSNTLTSIGNLIGFYIDGLDTINDNNWPTNLNSSLNHRNELRELSYSNQSIGYTYKFKYACY